MMDHELLRLKNLTKRNRQIIEILTLKVSFGDLSVYERIHLEMFLKKIQVIKNNLVQIESYRDVLIAKDFLKDLQTSQNNEEKKIIASIDEMLEMMTTSLIYNKKANFFLIKNELLKMLDANAEELIKNITN